MYAYFDTIKWLNNIEHVVLFPQYLEHVSIKYVRLVMVFQSAFSSGVWCCNLFTLKYHAWKACFISMCNLFWTNINIRCYLYVHAIIFYIKKTAAYFYTYIILVLKVQQSRVYFILKDDQSGKARIFTNIVNVIV